MKIRLFTILLVLFACTSLHASITAGGKGILFGEDHSFSVTALPSWVLDNQSGVKQGLHMVFYPKGQTWAKSSVLIYGKSVPTSQTPSVKSQVTKTVQKFHQEGSPQYKAKKQQALKLPNGKIAEIYYFSGDQWGNYEAAAYFKEKNTINYLVFSSKTKNLFDKHIGDFYKIAKSYKNLFLSPDPLKKEELAKLNQEAANYLKMPGGKSYELNAIQATGQKMANAMQECTAYFPDLKSSAFNYYVRINKEGKKTEFFVYPIHALSNCFSSFLSDTSYPAHSWKTFLLKLKMEYKP